MFFLSCHEHGTKKKLYLFVFFKLDFILIVCFCLFVCLLIFICSCLLLSASVHICLFLSFFAFLTMTKLKQVYILSKTRI